MKKKLAVATTAVLAMTMCLSMTACKGKANVGDLLPKMKGNYSTTVSTVTNFSSDANYEQTTDYADSNDVIVLAKTAKNPVDLLSVITYYSLYNVAKNMTVVDNVAEPIVRLNDTLYYSQNVVDNTYTLYDSARGVYATGVEGTVSIGVFTRKNGARIYVAPNGKVKEEHNPFVKVVPANAYEIGDYYISGSIGAGIFDVYSEKGELKKSVNLPIELNISTDAELAYPESRWTIGNKIFFQTERVLPDAEEEYDYFVDGDKIDLDTYVYDLKKGSGKELKNFDYLVTETFSINDQTIIAYVQKVDDNSLSPKYVQSFNASGKVAVDLQKLVPGATDVDVVDEDRLALSDRSGYTYIYKGAKRVATIYGDYDIAGNYAYDYNEMDKTLDIYDFKGNAILNVEDVIDYSHTYDGNLTYTVKPEATDITTYDSLYVFDVKKGVSTLIGTNTDTVRYEDEGLGYTVTTVSATATTVETHFYSNNTVINGGFNAPIVSAYNDETGKSYAIFATEVNGVTAYYSIIVSTPYVK